jgi:hypothetical protein
MRFGSEDYKGAFFLVKLLEDAAWKGMRHFDSHAYRTEDEQGGLLNNAYELRGEYSGPLLFRIP